MRLGYLLFASALVFGGRVWAAEPAGEAALALPDRAGTLPRLVLNLESALAYRDDRTASPQGEVAASGASVSHLGLWGAWFPGDGGFGFLVRAELEKYGLTGRTAGGSLVRKDASGFGARAALAYRGSFWRERLGLTAGAGFGALRTSRAVLDATFASTFLVDSDDMRGPVAELGADLPGDRWDFGVRAELWPRLWGARLGTAELSAFRAGGDVFARVRLFRVGQAAAFANLAYAFFATSGTGAGIESSQLQHRVAVGLGWAWSRPAPAPAPAPVAAVAPALPDERQAPLPRSLLGTVRAARSSSQGGAPLAGVRVEAASGQVAMSDATGAFRLEGVLSGLLPLRLSAPGHQDLDEAVMVEQSGETTVELFLQPLGATPSAAIAGLIRDERGAPVAAEVSVRELQRQAKVDPQGRFRLEVPAGRYTLVIEATGFEAQRKQVDVRPGEQSIYNVNLQRAP